MNTSLALTLLSAGLFLWLALRWWKDQGTWMNAELRAGQVVMVEKQLNASVNGWDKVKQGRMVQGGAVQLVGRPDQVFRLANGNVCPVENKTRKAFVVYESDIAELSLQAWLLRKNGEYTAPHGYVLVRNLNGVRKLLTVTLLNDLECGKLIYRALDIRSGAVVPKKSTGVKCRSCGHSTVCKSLNN